jgi:amidase
MDLVELAPGATIWFPCRVPGALLSLGDLHARMGRGEPVGCGLECAGVVRGTIRLAKRKPIDQPVIVTSERIGFVGSHPDDLHLASRFATAAAWRWLQRCSAMTEELALAIAAALLEVNAGGPAGANAVASFPLPAFREAGVALSGWPFAMIP